MDPEWFEVVGKHAQSYINYTLGMYSVVYMITVENVTNEHVTKLDTT